MADIRTLTVEGVTYNIKDATARADITPLQTNVTRLQTNVTQLQTNVTQLQQNTTDLPQIRQDVEQNANDINDLKSALNTNIYDPSTQLTANKLYDSNTGYTISYTNGYAVTIPVNGNKRYICSGIKGISDIPRYQKGVIMQGVVKLAVFDLTTDDIIIDIPDDATHVGINIFANSLDSFAFKEILYATQTTIENDLSDCEKFKDDVSIKKTGKNLLVSDFESGRIQVDTGLNYNNYSGLRTIGYIPVEPNTTYTLSCTTSDAPRIMVFMYDEDYLPYKYNDEYYFDVPYGFLPRTFTVPNDANIKYIRLSLSPFTFTNFQMEKGSQATAYEEPYTKYKIDANSIEGDIPVQAVGTVAIANKKWLFLGDSITANPNPTGWVAHFRNLIGANEASYIQAVGGATWCDGEPNVVYDGKPYQTQNYVGNQVAWCRRIGFASNAFDCIIISAGTNDTNTDYPTDADVEAQFYSGNTLKPLSDVDRTTWAGCIRWTIESLRNDYPNATIVLLTPLQRRVAMDGTTVTDMYPTIRQKRETIVRMAHRMGVHCINMDEVNITDMNPSDFADGLHPNDSATIKMADYVFRKILLIMGDYTLA